jgi:hypothetical protein
MVTVTSVTAEPRYGMKFSSAAVAPHSIGVGMSSNHIAIVVATPRLRLISAMAL